MRYLIAIILPPLAVLLCGKLFQTLLNAGLFVGGVALSVAGIGIPMIVVAMIHALLVVNSTLADKRNAQLIRAVERGR